MATKQKHKTFTLEELQEAMANESGFCLACGEPSEQMCEPDARNYHCGACGLNRVYGAQEILLMGLVR